MDIEKYIELNYPSGKQTVYNIRNQLTCFFDYIKIKPEEYVNEDRDIKKDIKEYYGYLVKSNSKKTGRPFAPKTIIVYMSALRGYLEEHDIIFSPRFWKKLHKKGKGNDTILEDRIPTREELEKILTHGNSRDRAFFMIMLSSGMREEELCKITDKHIDFESNPVMIKIPAHISKTKKRRFTFISIEAKTSLLEWLKIKDAYFKNKVKKSKGLKDYFKHKYGIQLRLEEGGNRIFPYRPNAPQTWWNRLLNKAGFTDKDPNTGYYTLHLYTLRKFANTKLKTVCNMLMVDMWIGHEVPYDYEKWTLQEHKQEYNKGMNNLLVYRTPANIEEVEKLKEKVDEIKVLKQSYEKLKEDMDKLMRDRLKDQYEKE